MNGSARWARRSSGWMGSRREIGAEGQQDQEGKLQETAIAGDIPRFEIPGWRERHGVVAGITGRGSGAGGGFDLGLWSEAPVGEVMSRWRAFRRQLAEFSTIALGNQVHGVAVLEVAGSRGWIQVDEIDGWVTTLPGTLLTVTVADCIPVYLLVPGRGIALLHAGWRGTAKGILSRGVEQLKEATGCQWADIIMHCGVGICGPCYEVGAEVMEGCGVPAEGAGPWHLDLRERLRDQARVVGLDRVTVSGWCSAHDRASFYSHRASRGGDGRMVAYIGMLAPSRN